MGKIRTTPKGYRLNGAAAFMIIGWTISILFFLWMLSYSDSVRATKAGTGNTVNVISEFEE